MIYPLKNKKGFISISMYMVIMAMVGIVFSFGFLSFVAQSKMEFRSKCTAESVSLQKKIIQAEKLLFALNPISSTLKWVNRVLQALRITFFWHPGFLAQITTAINQVKTLRQALDQAQKGIIRATDVLIKVETARVAVQMNKTAYDTRSRWTYFLNSFSFAVPDGIPKMAVQPDSDDIAPNYGLTKGYKLEQMVAYKWQLVFSTKSSVQKIQKGRGWFEMSCGATAEKEEKKWLVEIRKDKF